MQTTHAHCVSYDAVKVCRQHVNSVSSIITAGTDDAFTQTHCACPYAGSLIFTQLLFSGWVEGKRWADLYNPGSQGDGSFLGITNGFKPVSNGYPGTHSFSHSCEAFLSCICCFVKICMPMALLLEISNQLVTTPA